MQLYFVRHGKTEWNLEGRYQGSQGNSPLLTESLDDIKKLATYLSSQKIEFQAIYSSPLKRAEDTAIELQKDLEQPLTIKTDDRLKEFNLGKLEGMKFVDAEKIYPTQIEAFRHHPERYDPSDFGGEDYDALVERGKSFIDEIVHKYAADAKVLLVSHGAALVALIQSLLGNKLADLRKQGGLVNTSLSIISTSDAGASFQLIAWNETNYLQKKIEATDII